MSIYISVFLSSTVFLYAGEKIKDKKLNRFLIVIGLLIPSIIAACRADSVGTDVLVYGKAFYTQAVSSGSFITYVISKVDSMFSDFGFYFLTYILSRFFKDYHIGFFVYAILVQVFFYIAFKRCKKQFNTPVWFAMLLINLFLYNISLNLMRQCIAVPIAFLAWTYLADDKIKQYILFTIIAVVFHSSALITVLILPMYFLLRAGRNKQPVVKIMQGMAGFVLKNTLSDNGGVTRGICKMDDSNNLTKVDETRNIVKTENGAEADGVIINIDSLVSMNMWGLTPDFLEVLEDGFKEFFETEVSENPLKSEYLIPTFIGELLEQDRISVKVLRSNDTWYGMTYKEDVEAVKNSFRKMLEDGMYKEDLFADL